MSGIAKMTLSVFLAYSMYYLYGGSWARRGWKRENIVFFADGNAIPMRPFLKVPPPTSSPDKAQSEEEVIMSFHRYPEFLELGIMLLEIHFGQSLESMLGWDQEIVSVDDYFAAASEVYDRKKLDIISRGLRYAVESCLKPDFNMNLGMEDADDDELRSKIFDSVVQPLEEELERAFQEFISLDALDDEASTKIQLPFQLSTLGAFSKDKAGDAISHRSGATKNNKLRVPRSVPRVTRSVWRAGSCSPSPVPQSFDLFCNESKTREPPMDM